MPKFTPDPTKASGGFPVLPKGSGYLFEIGEPKSFHNVSKKEGKADSHGVAYLCIVKVAPDNPEAVGKKYYQKCFQHTPESQDMAKQFLNAALGCKTDEEFNTQYGSMDWGYDTDSKSAGDGWWKLKGQVIGGDVTIKVDPEFGEQNNIRWSVA